MKNLKKAITGFFSDDESWSDSFFDELEKQKSGEKMNIKNTKFVMATPEFREKCLENAIAWQDNEHQVIYETDMEARYVAAEFIANMQGFTLYENNAVYPKNND